MKLNKIRIFIVVFYVFWLLYYSHVEMMKRK